MSTLLDEKPAAVAIDRFSNWTVRAEPDATAWTAYRQGWYASYLGRSILAVPYRGMLLREWRRGFYESREE